MTYKQILKITMALSLTACVKIKDKKSSQNVDSGEVQIQQSAEIRYESDETPNQYTAVISIPAGANQAFRQNEKGERVPLPCHFQSSYCVDEQIEAGQKYEYVFSKDKKPLKTYYALVPQDLVVDKLVEVADMVPQLKNSDSEIVVNQYQRLFLLSGGQLVTGGKNLTFHFEEIVAEGGEIVTFLLDHEAAQGKPGARGGDLKIESRKGSGKMFVTMRGQRGGRGLDGEPWKERASTGAVGHPASYHTTDVHGNSYEVICSCTQNPGNGGKGEDGKRGHPGQQGYRGGDSGILSLTVIEDLGLDLRLSVQEGASGEGGSGGEGQLGGYGGAPGRKGADLLFKSCNLSYSKMCTAAESGPEGVKGFPGVDGSLGQLGVKEISCVQIGIKSKRCE